MTDAVAIVDYEGNYDTLFAQTRRAARRTGDILAAELNGRRVGSEIGADIATGIRSGMDATAAGRRISSDLTSGLDADTVGRQLGADLSDGAATGFNGGGLTSKVKDLSGPMAAMAATSGLAVGTALGAAVVTGFSEAVGRQSGKNLIQAQLGVDTAEAGRLGASAGKVWASNFGESMGDARDAVVSVRSSIGADLGAGAIEDLSAKALTFAQVFGGDVPEAVSVAGIAMRSGLAKDGTEAFDLLFAASQQMPAHIRGELLPVVEEYGTYLASLGFTGEEAFGLLVSGSQGGAIALDKTGDSLKELTIRATDMSETSVDAYEAAGLNATDMASKILAGGDTARGAFDDIIGGLLAIPDPTAQATAAIGLFGTPLEDLNVSEIPAFLEGLQSSDGALGDFEGSADAAADALGQGLEARLASLRRQGLQALVGFIETRVLPGVDQLIDRGSAFATVLWDRAEPAVDDVAAILGHLVSIGGQAYDTVEPIGGAVAAIGGGAALGAITGVASGLETTLGLLEENEGAVRILVSSMIGVAAIQALPLLATAWDFIALKIYAAAGAVDSFSLRYTVAAMNPAVLGIAAVAVAGFTLVDAINDADASYAEFRDSLDDDLDITSIASYEDAFAAVQRRESEASDQINTGGGFFDSIATGARGAVELLSPLENKVYDAANAVGKADDDFQAWNRRTEEMRTGLGHLYNDLGLTAPQVREFADELDFGEAEIRSGRAAFLISRHLRGLAEEAGYRGEQIRSAVTLTPAQLEEQKAAWEEISGAVSSSWGSALDSIAGLGSLENLTGDTIGAWYGMQTQAATDFAANIQEAFKLGYDPGLVSRMLQAGPAEAGPIVKAMVEDFSAELLWMVNSGESALRELNLKAIELARLTHLATTAASSEMAADLGYAMEITEYIGAMGANATASAIEREMELGVGEVARIARDYGIALADGVNPILNAVGADPIVQGAIGSRYEGQSQSVQHRNTGGPIFGPNVDRDVIPAMLTPGEFVHRKGAVDKWGLGAMAALNDGQAPPGWVIPGFNAGGAVLLQAGRMLEGAGARITEHPVWDRVDPVHVQGSYHYRNSSGTGADAFDANLAPGQSGREMAFFDEWAPKIAAMGLRVLWRVKGHFDHLHADLGKAGYGMGGSGNFAHFAPLPGPPRIGDWPLARGGEGAMQMAHEAAQAWSDSLYSPTSFGGGGGGDPASEAMARGWISEALGILGLPVAEWLPGLMRRSFQESGWNPRAVNNWDSNARKGTPSKGFLQTIDPTFRAFMLPGYGNIWDPVDNTIAAVRYMQRRYGHVNNLPAGGYNAGGLVTPNTDVFVHRHNFDRGGTLREGLNLVDNETGGPEPLVPAGARSGPGVNIEGDVVFEDRLTMDVFFQKANHGVLMSRL